VWTYGYLLRRISEVAEEYGITVIFVDEAYMSSKCSLHGYNCGKRIKKRTLHVHNTKQSLQRRPGGSI
jgi:putative transposase